ncbi:hypothetical protein KQI63_12425 [bacterium]|nr:hypothetical protein [bacterium]
MRTLLLPLLALLLIATPGYATDFNGVDLTGFADFYTSAPQTRSEGPGFQFGQVELDLEAPLAPGISFEAAIAFDPAAQTFGVGAFLIDFDIFESDESHSRQSAGIDHTGIVVGQFDVPFGLDWHVYPSIDRNLVTIPLVVERTHTMWNDFGIMAYTEHDFFNVVGFVVNGFPYESGWNANGDFLGYHGVGYDPEEASVSVREHTCQVALGGRAGFSFGLPVELGSSAAFFFDQDRSVDMTLNAFDVQTGWGFLGFKGEYLIHTIGHNQPASHTHQGWYGQLTAELNRYYLTGRFGVFSPDDTSLDNEQALSLGAGWRFEENIIFRCEQRYELDSMTGPTFLQVAVGF